jgi:tetratricopeptide (TPR) repeat protein
MEFASTLTLGQRLANAAVSIPRYLLKTVQPINLSIFYPHPGNWPPAVIASSLALVILLTAAACFQFRRRPYLIVGWLWFLITLIPVLGVVQVGQASMADRYTYLPSIGLLIAVVWLAADVIEKLNANRLIVASTTGAILVMLSVCTWYQQSFWGSTYDLFTHAIQIDDNNWAGHSVIASIESSAGDDLSALPHFQRTLELNPSDAENWFRYGLSLHHLGKTDEAIAAYQRSLDLRPHRGPTHYMLAMALAQQRKFPAAEEHFAEAARLSPNEAMIESGWAQMLIDQGRPDDAEAHLSRAKELAARTAQNSAR